MDANGRRSVVRGAAALTLVGAVIALSRGLPADRYLLTFVAWVRESGSAGMAAFAAAYVGACVLGLPAAVLTLGAGFAYGVGTGVLLVWLSASVGALLAFLLGRTLLRASIAARVARNARFATIDRAVGAQGFRIVLLTRLSPVFPFSLLNYAFGLTRVTTGAYAVATIVGILPGTTMYVYLGSLVTNLTELASGRTGGGTAREMLYALGLAATVAVTITITGIARRALADATGPATPPPSSTLDDRPLILPDDAHNRTLLSHVHPSGRTNPLPGGRYNLVVVGGGTAGLVAAAGAAGLGARVALVERHLLGGDCLNVGCVPSKALLAAAHAAAAARRGALYAIQAGEVSVDFPAVMERMRRLRAGLAPHDGVARFTTLGVDVYLGDGCFVGPTALEVDGRRLEFARAVITTGARAAVPPIPGLADAGYLTNETLFELTALPPRLVVIGGGPIGSEMAQAFARFGSRVTLLEMSPQVLPREDADAAAIVARSLAADGVHVECDATVTGVEQHPGERRVVFVRDGAEHVIATDAILVAVGRAPNVEGLGLEAAGVRAGPRGIEVDDRLRTANRRIYAAGDVASRFQFTHTADALARIVVENALFFPRKKASALTIPWCTYTQPEVAHVGLSRTEAEAQGAQVHTITIPFADVDRARLEGQDEGFFRVHLAAGSDRILGATLVAEHAGEMISELTVAMTNGLGLSAIGAAIHPYPTQAEAMRKAADAYNRTRLTPAVKRVFGWWLAARR